jgi:hypothetical protein
MVPLYGTYQQRHDGSWTPAIDAPAETQSPFRLSFSAWWKDKTVPRTTTRVRTAPAALAAGIPALDRSFVDRVLRPDRLQPGDRYHPIITALDQEGQPVGEAMALYTYHDKKGGVLAICTPSGGEFTETAQGALLPRVYLGYLASGLNVQKIFWYDLHNDGPDPGEAEHNFGLLRQDWTPKPAHDACRAMTTALGKNPAFVKRIHTKDTNPEKTWALLFRRTEDNRHILAAWTTDPSAPFGIHAAGHSAAALAHIVNDTVLYCPVTDEQIPRLSIRRTN